MFKKTIPIFALASSAQAFRSIPACDTYDGCKTKTAAADNLNYQDVVTQHSSYQDSQRVNAVIDSYQPNAYGLHAQMRSVPACTSFECKKGSAAKPWADTAPTSANWGQKNDHWQENNDGW